MYGLYKRVGFYLEELFYIVARMLHQYALHSKLGEGGYASVYKCTDAIGVRYACKVLPKDKNTRLRVQQEIGIMKRLVHSPKVVRFVDATEDDQAFYIIQELCRGGSVKDYTANYENYSENTVSSIVRGVLRGLIHMHEQGLIHRDIKAGNILLGDQSDDADVKIGDLGTAIFSSGGVTEVDVLVGTPWFLAPENLKYQYHHKSDVWSIGVVAYQLLSGRMPFNDRENPYQPSVAKIWHGILQEEPRFSGSRWDTISEDAKEFVKKCLVKNYEARPTALECLQDPWLTKTDCNDRFRGTQLSCKPFKYEDATAMRAQTISID